MQWLESQARALGVKFTIKEVQSLEEIVADEVAVIVNATGLGARTLRPIEDPLVEPIRGQVVLVRAKDIRECVMDASKSRENGGTRSTYIIPRPGGEEVICGGCYEVSGH
jgi:D-amino-acid oxidase